MAQLTWDAVGDRRYETGLDRGVIFLPDGTVKVWNGLTSVGEVQSREVKSYYMDGVKYLDKHIPGSYEATLAAFTYPDELDALLGTSRFLPGVNLHDQSAKSFSLSYRTLIGTDVDADEGYKVHIVYNVLAIPQDSASVSTSGSVDPRQFQWKLIGTPSPMVGTRPTNHISFDSRTVSDVRLTFVEEMLYGTDINDPALLDMVALLDELEDLS